MGSLRTNLFGENSRMISLLLLRPWIKPILVLIAILCFSIGFEYCKHLNNSIKHFEKIIASQAETISDQKVALNRVEEQFQKQVKAINELQEKQTYLTVLAAQRQMKIREVITNDQESKNWANQPTPDAISRLLNSSNITIKEQSK